MKGSRTIAFLIAALFVLAVFYGSNAVGQEVINLKYSSSYMPFEPPNVQANHALDLVEKKTNGKVKIKRFMGGALGDSHEQLGLISSGAVDIIALHADQFAQKLPLHQILNTEQRTSGEHALANVTALTEEIPETKVLLDEEEKQNNIKILSWHIQGPTGITTGFPADSLAALKGKKVSVISGFQRKVFKELGWIPVNVQIPELYESLSRGVIDGIFMATAAVIPLKWYEVGEAHLIMGDNTVLSQPLTFNLDSWNRLPGDVQQAFVEASRETALWSVKSTEKMVEKTYEKFKESDVSLVRLSEKENERFWSVYLDYAMAEFMKNARKMGVEDKAEVIKEHWEEMKSGS